jgi:adenine-specific DNA-methyltransferase
MSDPAAIELNHRVDLYVPSQCICGNPLPAALRSRCLVDVKGRFVEWFGGESEITIRGGYQLPGGAIADEAISNVFAFCDIESLELRRADVDALAVAVANTLTQDSVLRAFDNRAALWPNNLRSLRRGRNCACRGGGAVESEVKPEVVSMRDADQLKRLLAIEGLLRSFRSTNDAKELFCNLLNYEPASGTLPTSGWPKLLKDLLSAPPRVVAQRNGFRVVLLRLSSEELRRGSERLVIQRIVRDDPTFRGGIVVTDRSERQWEIVNFRQLDDDASKLMLRRMRVGVEGVRTATERLALLEVKLGEESSVSAADLQLRMDGAFDVEAMTKAFFTEIANWYFWALKHVKFPEDAPKEGDGRDHVSVIRLITRLIFCWFLKEKRLIPEEIFDEEKIGNLLAGFRPKRIHGAESTYYRAILQNLFFATLNTEIDKRRWASHRPNHTSPDENFMAHSLYRFKESFSDPEGALQLFQTIPFLNGGLFECLDRDRGRGHNPRYMRVDGFSRRPDSQAKVPDFLFFGDEKKVDLSRDYGHRRFRSVKVRGLLETLKRYRFTVEESTPLDEEVALDPELAGKIFENLLAAYNPETGQTARRQTGSFYTPRKIVDYMVDQTVIAHLKRQLETVLPQAERLDDRLRHLFSPDELEHQFREDEIDVVIESLDQMKVLDPAVGSGAFPMGMLHKLVLALGKLDPNNARWKKRQQKRLDAQISNAHRTVEDPTIRRRSIDALEEQKRLVDQAFQHHALDYGRKLYLIENCLYGVDIQPIAVQIAKMRFFISLVADQYVDDKAPNRGVRALPNLETNLVAANTLVRIERPQQLTLRSPIVDDLERALRDVRQRHFTAQTLDEKRDCREEDTRLRREIAENLQKSGWQKLTADALAEWDPYDQNASAGFFDAEWMFGVLNGFDVVIGNPPYVRTQVHTQGETGDEYLRSAYASARRGNYDLYVVFVERGLSLCSAFGQLGYILPHKFFIAEYGQPLRTLLNTGHHVREIVDFQQQQVFPGATNYVCLLFLSREPNEKVSWREARNLSQWLSSGTAETRDILATDLSSNKWIVSTGPDAPVFDRLNELEGCLGDLPCRIFQGLATSADDVFVLEYLSLKRGTVKARSASLNKTVELESSLLRPLLKGSEISRFGTPPWKHAVLFPYTLSGGKAEPIPLRVLKADFPATYEYLVRNKQRLLQRSKTSSANWWLYPYPKNLALYSRPKILIQVLSSSGTCFFDDEGTFSFVGGGTAGGNAIVLENDDETLARYLVGILNSSITKTWVSRVGSGFRGGFFAFGKASLATLPLPWADGQPVIDGKVVQLVKEIEMAKKRRRDSSALEHKLEARVKFLYGLDPGASE